MVVRDNLNYHIRTLLKDAYENWDRDRKQFAERRERERSEFLAHRGKEADEFEKHQRRKLDAIPTTRFHRRKLHDAAGKPFKKRIAVPARIDART